MTASKAQQLSKLFRSAAKPNSTNSISAAVEPDQSLKSFVSSIDTSSSSISEAIVKRKQKLRNFSKKKSSAVGDNGGVFLPRFSSFASKTEGGSMNRLSVEISSILSGGTSDDLYETRETDDETSSAGALDIPWISSTLQSNITLRRKEVSRERKQKWIFKHSQVSRFDRLVRMCASKLGTEATIQVFGKLGRETGVKEYNALIGICIENARSSNDDEVALQQFYKAFQLFKSMREQGFQLEEETYGPFLRYLIEKRMEQEFHFFCDVIKEGNPKSVSRLGYYEMLLRIEVNDREKIQELSNYILADSGKDNIHLQENYLLALCESGPKGELVPVLERIDITKVSSMECVSSIFKFLGKASLESFAEKFLLELKTCEYGADYLSAVIFDYVINIPNLALENIISNFEELHVKLEMEPSAASYEKFITHCCDRGKVHVATDLVDKLCEAGLSLSIDAINYILHSSEENYEYNMVRRIYSLISKHNMKPNSETFRSMINLKVKMKDFGGAYGLLDDLKKLQLMPTSGMYNAIMGGYYREKNIPGAMEVYRQMKKADVKPDSHTYSYLISNSVNEEDIIKYYEEMKQAGVQVLKHVYMALINAYAACGLFEKAKQVLLDKGLRTINLNGIKSTLASALAYHGQISDALAIYEEMKKAGWNLEPKTTIAVIESLQSEGELSRLLQLLNDLHEQEYWMDGCYRVVSYCVRHKLLSATVDLLKQLKDIYSSNELAMEVFLDEPFFYVAELGPTHLQFGIDLLQAVKDELGLYPSRKSLDFLLSTSASAKNVQASHLIWKEYQAAGLPYNVISFVRMYQALLASGDNKFALEIQKEISSDDPHVNLVIKTFQKTYSRGNRKKKGKKKCDLS